MAASERAAGMLGLPRVSGKYGKANGLINATCTYDDRRVATGREGGRTAPAQTRETPSRTWMATDCPDAGTELSFP